ncbi:heavy metal translocating P-type ATPase [Leptospira wolffii]|uniref:heavy metal translocating P-type ATPase n=1 Tax=Leptospira wolffii TaxID=409998 RepID=UPI000353EEEF|nr:heavy metal translocating P-type ATPase [Leptospira wolffii]EPG67402.1 cadmium-exporting ATPase [Leptospira wolffii serovar Khorat str. Khorat-H2]
MGKKIEIKENEKADDCCSSAPSSVVKNEENSLKNKREEDSSFRIFLPVVFSFILMGIGIVFDSYFPEMFLKGWGRFAFYALAYLPVGLPVLKEAYENLIKGEVFTEFLLMGIATIGAFYLGEYPEGVAVMLFYSVGEIFQNLSVQRAKLNIKNLLDQRPDRVLIVKGKDYFERNATEALIGEVLQLKPGEKLALDGELLSESASFNTAALTGESKPDTKYKGESVLAGMINLTSVIEVKITTAYQDSKLSKILTLMEEAASQKAPTEKFIRKFAKIYTPIVVFLAMGICGGPYFFLENYIFSDWFYRALVFLVISCPCALVISIPLGYFGGIGAASRNGILVKGSNYLDVMASVQNVVMDKTGTLTEGVFEVQEAVIRSGFGRKIVLDYVNLIESKSTHPVATAIHKYVGNLNKDLELSNTEEIPGFGMKAKIGGSEVLVGNFKLLDRNRIEYDVDPTIFTSTIIAISINGIFAGYLTIADKIKEDSSKAINELHQMNIGTMILSGDKISVVRSVAESIGVKNFFGDLLPENKVEKVKEIKAKMESVAFVGDGVNDAPVAAASDVGIAMGGLGSDATIEISDIVIQDDKPTKIPMMIRIGRETRKIVWQNIALTFAIKVIVLILGAGGLATMWEAVFADVGVSFLAILNSIRIQRKSFS